MPERTEVASWRTSAVGVDGIEQKCIPDRTSMMVGMATLRCHSKAVSFKGTDEGA